jgi:transcriptional regulator with XRE-family HTH domain
MELGFSQEELGEKLGVSYQQVQKYENGKNELTVTRLQDMAIHLRTSMEFFFKGAKPNKNTKAPTYGDSVREKQLVKLYRSIDDGSVQSALFQLVKRLGQKMSRASGVSNVVL